VSLIEYCDESEGGECGVVCKNFVATVGYRGLAPIGTKREGDGRTPVGIYPLRRGLCYERDFVSAFPMEQYDENDMWCEDADSDDYNTFVSNPAPGVKGDRLWQLRNTQYRYIVVVEYNTDPIVKGAGSAIFIHAWRAEGKSTAGCIGMAEASVKQLVEWLDPALNPHIVILQN
jgi:L,D-peptidoglycan transpeptidase YkuD (ErfK/YbiS/YcfS/YnhG family)